MFKPFSNFTHCLSQSLVKEEDGTLSVVTDMNMAYETLELYMRSRILCDLDAMSWPEGGLNPDTTFNDDVLKLYTDLAKLLGPKFWVGDVFNRAKDEERNAKARNYYERNSSSWKPFQRVAFYIHFFRNAASHQPFERPSYAAELPAGLLRELDTGRIHEVVQTSRPSRTIGGLVGRKRTMATLGGMWLLPPISVGASSRMIAVRAVGNVISISRGRAVFPTQVVSRRFGYRVMMAVSRPIIM